jgi:hypothetical protein
MAQTGPSSPNSPTLRLSDGRAGAAFFHRTKLSHSWRNRDTAAAALILALGTWLPLICLSYHDGVLLHGTKLPLLYDFGPHVRSLFSLPVLLLANIWSDRRVQWTIDHLVSAGLVPKDKESQFAGIIQSTIRLRDSRVATVLLVLITACVEWFAVSSQVRMAASSWIAPVAGGPLSSAGYWYVFAALPIYQFILLRWGYRIIVWGYFVARMAKMDLLLTATHPDRAGGIGFLGRSIVPFGAIGLSLSATFSGTIASRVLFGGENIYHELPAYGLLVAFILIISIGPLLFFAPKLIALKYQGLAQYGTLATAYTAAFQRRWINEAAVDDPELLGTGDIQSLADLGNGYETIEGMKPVPVTLMNLIGVALPTLIPILPLAATVMPVGDLLRALVQFVV